MLNKLLILSSLFIFSGSVLSADFGEWCKENKQKCDAVINTCESDAEIDCDALMKNVMTNNYQPVGRVKSN